MLVLYLTVRRTKADIGSISYRAEDRGCVFLSLPVLRTEANVGSISYSVEDRG